MAELVYAVDLKSIVLYDMQVRLLLPVLYKYNRISVAGFGGFICLWTELFNPRDYSSTGN